MPDLSFIHISPFYELTALVVFAAVIGIIGVLGSSVNFSRESNTYQADNLLNIQRLYFLHFQKHCVSGCNAKTH
jgi:hypothetical protein